MTEDEIRGTEFPRVVRGYDPAQVDRRLLAMARLLDAGFSFATFTPQPAFARVMRGYDPEAVDRFFGTLASDGAPPTSPPGPLSPWRVAYGEPEPRDGSGARDGGRRARRLSAARRRYARDCRAEWLGVSQLPGTRLRRTSGQTRTILGGYGEVLMMCRGDTLTVGDGGLVLRNDPGRAQVVDAGTGDPFLRWIDGGSYRRAWAVVLRPERRWLRFPVQGTRLRNAVMRAVDESDAEVLWFRKTNQTVTEAIVRPDCDVTPEILCLIECAASWLGAYLKSAGRRGGG